MRMGQALDLRFPPNEIGKLSGGRITPDLAQVNLSRFDRLSQMQGDDTLNHIRSREIKNSGEIWKRRCFGDHDAKQRQGIGGKHDTQISARDCGKTGSKVPLLAADRPYLTCVSGAFSFDNGDEKCLFVRLRTH